MALGFRRFYTKASYNLSVTHYFGIRRSATSREVPGCIPDGVIGIFPSYGPGVDSTCNTEYQEYFLGAKCG